MGGYFLKPQNKDKNKLRVLDVKNSENFYEVVKSEVLLKLVLFSYVETPTFIILETTGFINFQNTTSP